MLFLDISVASCNKIYRRNFLINNNLSYTTDTWYEDLEFGFRVIYHASVVSKEDVIIFGYRQRAGSIMHTLSEKIIDKKTVVYRIKQYLEEKDELHLFEDGFKFMFFKMYISIIYQSMKNQGPVLIKRKILKQIFSDPFFYNEILRNSKVYMQINTSEKLLFLQLKYRILGLRSFPIYNALLKLERK